MVPKVGGGLQGVEGSLQHPLVLQLADPTKDYIVTTDANDFAMGAVLSQVLGDGEHPVT